MAIFFHSNTAIKTTCVQEAELLKMQVKLQLKLFFSEFWKSFGSLWNSSRWVMKIFFEQIRIQEELPKNQKHSSVIIWFCHHIMVQCNITSFETYSTTRIENSFCQLVQIIRIISASYCFWVWMCMPPRLLWLFKMTPWCQVRKPSNNFWFKSPVSS